MWKFPCPRCDQPVHAEPSEIGRKVVCTRCRAEAIVPSKRVLTGDHYGEYRVLGPLGAGATSEVHLAEEGRGGLRVALKILFVDQSDPDTDIERFLREARNTSKLNHPCLVKTYRLGVQRVPTEDGDEDRHYLAMEYVDGDTVETFLDHGKLDEPDALAIARNVADAMRHAWGELGLVHRDIKPANVMLTRDTGATKLTDLGIAKSVQEYTRLTRADTVIGSPPYMSPEQCAPNRPIDFHSDIYSLGASLFHMLTSEYPFLGRDPRETVYMHQFSPVPDPRRYNEKLSLETAALIRRMMSKRPEDRHSSWDALIDDLEHLLGSARKTRPRRA